MKQIAKFFLAIHLVVGFFLINCNSDTLSPEENQIANPKNVLISEIAFSNENLIVELWNNNPTSVNLNNWWLCNGPGEYQAVVDQDTKSSNISEAGEIAANQYAYIFFTNTTGTRLNGSVALYQSRNFSQSDEMVSYLQWGAPSQGRATVAFDAKLWSSISDRINNAYSITFTNTNAGNNYSHLDWQATKPFLNRDRMIGGPISHVFISEVSFQETGAMIELRNPTSSSVSLNNWQFCHLAGNYRAIVSSSDVSFVNGDYDPDTMSLAANGRCVFNYNVTINRQEGDIALYKNPFFTSSSEIVSYVQWGSEGLGRENVAVEATLWTAGTFVNDDFSIILVDIDSKNEPSGWSFGASSLGLEN